MNNPIQTLEHKGLTVKIYPDPDAQSPEEWRDENLFLVHYHRDFNVSYDEIVTREEIRCFYTGEKSERLKELKKEYYIFPVAAYIHGGVSLSLGAGGHFPDQQWDVCHVGAVLVSKKEWKTLRKAESAARALLSEWNQYLSGDVYGYVVESPDGEHLDSCWGVYGLDYCKESARTEAEYYAGKIEEAKKMEKSAFAL